jgi:hypothetical protein
MAVKSAMTNGMRGMRGAGTGKRKFPIGTADVQSSGCAYDLLAVSIGSFEVSCRGVDAVIYPVWEFNGADFGSWL